MPLLTYSRIPSDIESGNSSDDKKPLTPLRTPRVFSEEEESFAYYISSAYWDCVLVLCTFTCFLHFVQVLLVYRGCFDFHKASDGVQFIAPMITTYYYFLVSCSRRTEKEFKCTASYAITFVTVMLSLFVDTVLFVGTLVSVLLTSSRCLPATSYLWEALPFLCKIILLCCFYFFWVWSR